MLTGVRGVECLTWNKLGTVDKLGEVGSRGTHDRGGGDGPTLWVNLTADLVIHQLHLFATLQRLEMAVERNIQEESQKVWGGNIQIFILTYNSYHKAAVKILFLSHFSHKSKTIINYYPETIFFRLH